MTRELILHYVIYVNVVIIWYFLLVNSCYILLLVTAFTEIFSEFKQTVIGQISIFLKSKTSPPISILIAAYNEEDCIINTIKSILNSNYPNLQIIVISDGSTDETMKRLNDTFNLYRSYPIINKQIQTNAAVRNYYSSKLQPNITVIDKEHSGKADTLNIGINACRTPLFITVDADTLLEPDAVSYLAYSLLSNPHTVAEGGAIYIVNGCDYNDGILLEKRMSWSPLVAVQTCEYLRAFLFGRTGWKPFNGPIQLAGALTLFEHQAVIDVGGFTKNSPGEDMEIIVKLHHRMRSHNYPYRVGFTFASAAWTTVPSTLHTLWSQRDRWHRGLIDSLMRHKTLLFNPAYGATGVFSYPFQFIIEFLGPLIELTGYIAVLFAMYYQIIDWRFALLFFGVSWGFSTIITLGTTLISMASFNKYKRSRDIFLQIFVVFIETIGYRQLFTLCRVVATFRYLYMRLTGRR